MTEQSGENSRLPAAAGSVSNSTSSAPPHPLDGSWHLNIEGKNYGPYSGHEIREFAREGRITGSAQVVPVGGTTWKAAKDDPVLRGFFETTKVAAPPREDKFRQPGQRRRGRDYCPGDEQSWATTGLRRCRCPSRRRGGQQIGRRRSYPFSPHLWSWAILQWADRQGHPDVRFDDCPLVCAAGVDHMDLVGRRCLQDRKGNEPPLSYASCRGRTDLAERLMWRSISEI